MAFLGVVLLCLFLHTAIDFSDADADNGCSHSWKPFGDKCYRVFEGFKRTWSEAERSCTNDYEARLANSKTEEINHFLTDLMTQNGTDEAWIGLERVLSATTQKYQWVWSDDEIKTYDNFASTGDVDPLVTFQCAAMDKTGKWNSISQCISRHTVVGNSAQFLLPWICEIDRDMSGVEQ